MRDRPLPIEAVATSNGAKRMKRNEGTADDQRERDRDLWFACYFMRVLWIYMAIISMAVISAQRVGV